MKKIITLLMLALCSCVGAYSQQSKLSIPKEKVYLTKAENINWLQKISQVSNITLKLEETKKKIVSNAYFVTPDDNRSSFWKKQVIKEGELDPTPKESEVNCDCKVGFYLVIYNDEYELNARKYNYVSSIMRELNKENIKEVIVDDSLDHTDSHSDYECGKVYLISEDRKLKRVIKRLLMN